MDLLDQFAPFLTECWLQLVVRELGRGHDVLEHAPVVYQDLWMALDGSLEFLVL